MSNNISTYDIAGADGIGNITVDSDQPNQGPNVSSGTGFWIKARSGNMGNCQAHFIDSDSNGFEWAPGEAYPVQIFNLNELYFRADTNGNKLTWMKF